jgi:hypothetical protein
VGSVNLSVGPATLDALSLTRSDSSPVVGTALTVGLTVLDEYQNVDIDYSGSQCLALRGASNSPDGTGATYPNHGSGQAGASEVQFIAGLATGADAPSLTLYDSRLVDPWRPTSRAGIFGSAALNVTPGALRTFAVVPGSTIETAGTAFNVRLTALDPYRNVDTNFTGARCVTFSGPDDAPNGAARTIRIRIPVPGVLRPSPSSMVTSTDPISSMSPSLTPKRQISG